MLGNEGLGHNKFLVFSRKGKPAAVWTGSTNWATTGLCTQMNDGILVEDPGLATEYRTQWKRLRDDHYINEKGKERLFDTKLMTANDQAKTGGGAAAGKWTLWFSRTSDERDLRAVIDVVNGLIVRGNEELARRCLVNIMGVLPALSLAGLRPRMQGGEEARLREPARGRPLAEEARRARPRAQVLARRDVGAPASQGSARSNRRWPPWVLLVRCREGPMPRTPPSRRGLLGRARSRCDSRVGC